MINIAICAVLCLAVGIAIRMNLAPLPRAPPIDSVPRILANAWSAPMVNVTVRAATCFVVLITLRMNLARQLPRAPSIDRIIWIAARVRGAPTANVAVRGVGSLAAVFVAVLMNLAWSLRWLRLPGLLCRVRRLRRLLRLPWLLPRPLPRPPRDLPRAERGRELRGPVGDRGTVVRPLAAARDRLVPRPVRQSAATEGATGVAGSAERSPRAGHRRERNAQPERSHRRNCALSQRAP